VKYFYILVLLSGALWGQANPTPPERPRSVPPATRPTPTGSKVAVHNGDNLQSKYNAASCGQDLVLDDGATFTGNFVFNKQCAAPNWILVEGTGCANGTVTAPVYVTQGSINSASVPPWPAPALTHYAKITSTNGAPPIVTTDGSNVPGKYNYLGCLEVTASVSQGFLVGLTNGLTETLASQFGDHLMFDRMYVHGINASSMVQMTRGFLVIGSNISVVNSYVSQIYSSNGDAQAILGAHGPGPYLIQNNFLSASTEIIMFGGTGRTPGYSCTIAPSPAPTTTSATVTTCIDGASGVVSTPAVGTCAMFYIGTTYTPANWVCITANTSGALTWLPALPSAPSAGVGKIKFGMVPADITITQNYLYKLPTWNPSDPSYDGVNRSSKDFVEDKYGVRWLISGNAMVNSWNAGQNMAFNINVTDQNGDCPWCTSSDVTLTNNVVKNIAGAFVIITSQSYTGQCPGPLKRVLIQNNLFWPTGLTPHIASGGVVFELAGYTGCPATGGGTDSLQIIHNHLLGGGINMQLAGGTPYNFTNLVIRDNLTEFDQYRWTNQCPDTMPVGRDGTLCMNADVSTSGTWTARNNAIVNSGAINGGQGQPDSVLISRYGSAILSTFADTTLGMNYSAVGFVNFPAIGTDYHNFALAAGSRFHGRASDGTDPGVNFGLLDAGLGIASTGTSVTGSGSVKGSVQVQ